MPAKMDETPDIAPIVVLDLIMPHGKRIRDCTDAELKKFGDLLLKKIAGRLNEFPSVCGNYDT